MTDTKKYPGSTACPLCAECVECGLMVHEDRPTQHKATCSKRCPHTVVKQLYVCKGGEGPDDADDFVECVACQATGFRYISGKLGIMSKLEKKA